jgi:PAS domain-containing protein
MTCCLAVRPTLYPGLSVSASLPMNHVLTDWYKDRAVILVVSATLLLLATVATMATQRSMQRVAQAQADIAEANAQLQGSNIDIAKSLSLVQATLESTADAILVVDRNGGIGQYNRKFVEYTGIPQSVLDDPSQVAQGRKLMHDQLTGCRPRIRICSRGLPQPLRRYTRHRDVQGWQGVRAPLHPTIAGR